MARIVMAMSGGVDSSVAAALLVRAGHDVIGVFMRHGEPELATCAATPLSGRANGPTSAQNGATALPILPSRPDHKQGCCSASDAEDARRVADALGVPFYALNLSADFARIIDYFVDEYTAARTPNPCVLCNNWLKFGKLFEYADSVGAEFVATGHYARMGNGEFGMGSGESQARMEPRPSGSEENTDPTFSRDAQAERSSSFIVHRSSFDHSDCPALLRGLDFQKDQSYVLFGVARQYLPRMLFPLGGYRKSEIRELAREMNLRVADKRDSQEICFVASGDHADFIRRHRGTAATDSSGEIVLADGTIVGRHGGIEGFTIGQRKGLRVAMGEPYYVTRIEADTRRVVIGRRDELARRELLADRVNWLIDPPSATFRAEVQIRYNSAASPAVVEPLGDNRFRVQFDDPRHSIAPGQAAVCYDGPRVLGGGWIQS